MGFSHPKTAPTISLLEAIDHKGNPRCFAARLLAYVTGRVNQEILLRYEYPAAENRILRGQIKGRVLVIEGEVTSIDQRRKLTEAVLATTNSAE